MVDMYSHHGCQDWIKDDNSAEFLVDLVRDLFGIRAQPLGPDPTEATVDSCSYHYHGEDGSCYHSRP